MAYKYVPIAKEDTYKLIEEAQKGDRDARELIVSQNIGLVKNLAMKYASGYYEPEDLMQVGFVGLVKAIDRFDTKFDVMFSTYAVPMILGEIKRFLRDDGKIKISRQLKTEMKNLKAIQQEYYNKYGVS
ncbi:MAG: sigma-70 family RNA polymerase sigma factor, partial [Anaerovoracaceae bacterium]